MSFASPSADAILESASTAFTLSGKSAKELAKKFFDREILAEQLEKILILTKNNQPELVENVAEGIYK